MMMVMMMMISKASFGSLKENLSTKVFSTGKFTEGGAEAIAPLPLHSRHDVTVEN